MTDTKIFQKGCRFRARGSFRTSIPHRARHRLFPLAYATVCISNSLDAALANANRSSTPPVRAEAPRTPLSVVATGATPASLVTSRLDFALSLSPSNCSPSNASNNASAPSSAPPSAPPAKSPSGGASAATTSATPRLYASSTRVMKLALSRVADDIFGTAETKIASYARVSAT